MTVSFLLTCLLLAALLERRRRRHVKKTRDEIDRFMEWGIYDTHPPMKGSNDGPSS